MIPPHIDKSKIPHKPGIYMHKDSDGNIMYVGKAVDLYSRVSSYFSGSINSFKTAHMVERIADIDTIVVESELEALILEANLIKQYLPPYNIRLTDDKDYLYIVVTKEAFPQITTGRKKDVKAVQKYYGPFPSSRTVKDTLKKLRRVFPWCSNPPKQSELVNLRISELGNQQKDTNEVLLPPSKNNSPTRKFANSLKSRPCFYYHLKLCPGACVGAISQEEYQKIIDRFIAFMEKGKTGFLDDLEKEMNDASKRLDFEEAGRIKKIINGVEYLTSPTGITKYLENPNFLEDERQRSLEQLQKDLHLPELPERIECYDISNFQGTDATGSMVVLTHGEVDKSQYRKFKIKISGKPDDFAMHAEMMRRRLKHKEWPYPQLFIIDGGRGQVRAAYEEIEKYKAANLRVSELANWEGEKNENSLNTINISLSLGRGQGEGLIEQEYSTEENIEPNPPTRQSANSLNNSLIFGLAKRDEWLYPPEGDVIKLPKRSLSLRLLQKIRDESHRFAITYHRKLRKKSSGY